MTLGAQHHLLGLVEMPPVGEHHVGAGLVAFDFHILHVQHHLVDGQIGAARKVIFDGLLNGRLLIAQAAAADSRQQA